MSQEQVICTSPFFHPEINRMEETSMKVAQEFMMHPDHIRQAPENRRIYLIAALSKLLRWDYCTEQQKRLYIEFLHYGCVDEGEDACELCRFVHEFKRFYSEFCKTDIHHKMSRYRYYISALCMTPSHIEAHNILGGKMVDAMVIHIILFRYYHMDPETACGWCIDQILQAAQ